MNARGTSMLQRHNPVGWLAFVVLAVAAGLFAAAPAARAQDDLPGRVARVADVGGELFLVPQDQPTQWTPIGLNYPVTGGDNLWAGADARAEIDFGGGQFRLGSDTNLHVSRLDDRQFALFVAQGRISIRVRVLDPGEAAYVDTPNTQLVLTRPGLYRVDVSDDREHTRLVVREGEANVLTPGASQQVLPGQTAVVDGPGGGFSAVNNGVATDAFDAWAAGRDRRYERGAYANYVSPQMVGAAELDQYGSWSQVPEYGTVWYPNDVAADWAPYRNGYWVDVGAWGPTWVDAAPWGYAPFHYGRWVYFGNRWGWAPGAYVARPIWAPALVGWTGGPGWGVAVSVGPAFGWVPLGWGEPYRPWWGRCSFGCWDRYNRPYAVSVNRGRPDSPPPPRYRNASAPGGLSVVQGNTLMMRRPVHDSLVSVPASAAGNAPVLGSAPMVRSEPGRIPTRAVGGASPPPASTFYPTLSRPANAPVPVALQPNRPQASMDATTRTRASPSSVPGGSMSAPVAAPAAGGTNPASGVPGMGRTPPQANAFPGSTPGAAVAQPSRSAPQTAAPTMQAPSRQSGQLSAPAPVGSAPVPATPRNPPSTYPASRADTRVATPPPVQSAPVAPAVPSSGLSRSAPRPQPVPAAAPAVPQAPAMPQAPMSRSQPVAPPAAAPAAPQSQAPAPAARSGNDGGNMTRQGRGDPGNSPDRNVPSR